MNALRNRFRRIARELRALSDAHRRGLEMLRAHFSQAAELERAYARLESPAYLRRPARISSLGREARNAGR